MCKLGVSSTTEMHPAAGSLLKDLSDPEVSVCSGHSERDSGESG
jgi:hypothetical protein